MRGCWTIRCVLPSRTRGARERANSRTVDVHQAPCWARRGACVPGWSPIATRAKEADSARPRGGFQMSLLCARAPETRSDGLAPRRAGGRAQARAQAVGSRAQAARRRHRAKNCGLEAADQGAALARSRAGARSGQPSAPPPSQSGSVCLSPVEYVRARHARQAGGREACQGELATPCSLGSRWSRQERLFLCEDGQSSRPLKLTAHEHAGRFLFVQIRARMKPGTPGIAT